MHPGNLSYNKKLNFIAACTGMLLFGIALITLGSVIPGLKARFHLDELSAGTLFSLLPLGILTGSLLFGPLCDRYGYKTLLLISYGCLFTGFEGMAYGASPELLKAWVWLTGLAGGAINGATNALVADISDNGKSANLSLLGVCFAIGALGMPFVLGALDTRVSFNRILAFTGLLILLITCITAFVRFPVARPPQRSLFSDGRRLASDRILLLFSFFLFFQSSLEAIIHNWVTLYLIEKLSMDKSSALYTLSLNVAGMAAARLLAGSLFRHISAGKTLVASLSLMAAGSALLQFSGSFLPAAVSLTILGAGMAAGFPVMLSFIAERYRDIPATAFSFALVIALTGNMLLNYCMGVIAHTAGIGQLTSFVWAEVLAMGLLCIPILKSVNNHHQYTN